MRMMSIKGLKGNFVYIILLLMLLPIIIYLHQTYVLTSITKSISTSIFNGVFFLGLFIFIIYKRWRALVNSKQEYNYFLGSLVLIFSMLLLYLSKLSGILIIENFSLIITLMGIILFLFGKHRLSVLFLPILFLIVPLGVFDQMLHSVSIYLQIATASVANIMLNSLGVLTLQDGPYLFMPYIILVVDRSCNGINHITALVVLALVLGISKSRKGLFFLFLFSFLLGLLLNGLRVTLIGLWAIFFEGDFLHGPGSIFYVSFIFITGSFLMIVLSMQFEDKPLPIKDNGQLNLFNHKKVIYSGLSVLIILSASALFIHSAQPQAQSLNSNLENIPAVINGFHAANSTLPNADINVPDADMSFERWYAHSAGDTLFVYLAYLARQSQEREIVNYRNQELYNRSSKVRIGDGFELNAVYYAMNQRPGWLYFGYFIDGELYQSPVKAKLATLRMGVFKQRTNGALLVVWSNVKPEDNSSVPENLRQFFREFIPAVEKILTLPVGHLKTEN